jgi:hypothetical protein
MQGMMMCAEMLDQNKSALDLGYYEILDGADMRAVLSGFYRIFLGFGDLYRISQCVWYSADFGMFAYFYH